MNTLTRRDFLKIASRVLTISGLAIIIAPIVAYFYPPKLEETPSEPVKVGNKDEFPIGASKTIPFGRYPALVINTDEGLRAYSAVCTHFACICKWDAQKGIIACPCHDGLFDPLDGRVLSGPPPTPLEPLSITIVGDEIFIGGDA